jgi:hypothetical protein
MQGKPEVVVVARQQILHHKPSTDESLARIQDQSVMRSNKSTKKEDHEEKSKGKQTP